jgi:probable phosphoglycerate mutase
VTILLVRHGETGWNRERRYQGWLDSPLTERGVAQASAIGLLLASLPDAAEPTIVASPLGRARRTAEIIRDQLRGIGALQVDERLRELTMGSWDSLTFNQIEAISPGIFEREGPDWCFASPDGESYAGFAGRVGEWLGEQDESLTTIVVAHGIVSRVLRGLYAGLPRADALTLPVPQDRIFRLSGGKIEAIAIRPSPRASPGAGRLRG